MLSPSKYNRILQLTICILMMASVFFLLANFARAATVDPGLNYAAGTGLSNVQDVRIIIAKIIRIALGFLGIIAVSLIMYAGWLWMTSQGNEEKIEQAKKILKNAIIGLIIILSAFAIVSFVINQLNDGGERSGGGPGNKPPSYYGLSALGNGIIESHYPARDQKEVPRNTSIIITFRELMKADTLCKPKDTAPTICDGDDINIDIVRIFKQSEEINCARAYSSNPAKCASLVKEAKVYSTADGKTYVFAPKNYLGSPSEYINYTVYLGEGLLRKTGEPAFPGLQKDYGWSFEVSNKIDLTPPQVKRNGVIPAPDNVQDTVAPGAGQQASGTITVNSRPSVYSEASVWSVSEDSDNDITISQKINKDCELDGEFIVDIKIGPIATLYKKITAQEKILLGQGKFGTNNNGNKQIIFDECSFTLIATQANNDFIVGNSWTIILKKATAADTITVGGITYTASNVESGANFKVSLTGVETAGSIAAVINASNPDVTASPSDNVVTVTAKVAGLDGNSIDLSSSNSAALTTVAMKNGKDKKDDVNNNCIKNPPQPNCKTDEPMNTAIQIEFNEAIMPLVVSGASDDLKDYVRVVNASSAAQDLGGDCSMDATCKSFKCDGTTKKCVENIVNAAGTVAAGADCATDADCKSSVCGGIPKKCVAANYLEGKFAVSNQYRTVDFLSDKECGFNACGEKIYCLPANSHLRVELSAASLIPCADKDNKADNSLCQDKSPFNTCDTARKFCRDSASKYFPQANEAGAKIVDGVVDAAFNSLDGNRDGSAYGPASYYNENTPVAASGDSYQWSFYISNKLDLTPPKIKDPTIPAKDDASVDLNNAITISFDKLMLSSRLTTGSLTIQNGKDSVLHYLLNLRSFLDQPLGYWVTNEGKQSVPGASTIDQTDVYINHSPFSSAASYKAQAGSGLKDIYQNCFKPCAGPACSGVNDQLPCCCNGAPGTSCP